MRLAKYMAACGVASRRHSETLIQEGRVAVNGQIVTQMGTQVQPGDVVALDGELLVVEEEKRYVIYHKPAGEVTTAADEKGRRTVMDTFADYPVRLYPVGRLDYDSEGLLLLTNDGALTQRLLHPSREVKKVYLARITGKLPIESIRALRAGMFLPGEKRRTAPAEIRVIREEAFASVVLVTLHEGRNRQVRRMFETAGHRVLMLRRVQFGPLELKGLERGKWRELTGQEVAQLKKCAGFEAQTDGTP